MLVFISTLQQDAPGHCLTGTSTWSGVLKLHQPLDKPKGLNCVRFVCDGSYSLWDAHFRHLAVLGWGKETCRLTASDSHHA